MEELRTQHITSQTELKNSLETASQKIVDLENQLKTAKSEESISKKKLAQVCRLASLSLSSFDMLNIN